MVLFGSFYEKFDLLHLNIFNNFINLGGSFTPVPDEHLRGCRDVFIGHNMQKGSHKFEMVCGKEVGSKWTVGCS